MKKTPNNKIQAITTWYDKLNSGTIYSVEDITEIPTELLKLLKAGDKVVEKADTDDETTYMVAYINQDNMSLVHVNSEYVIEVKYEEGEYDETIETRFEDEQGVKDLIEADKDIISQIEVEYDEDENTTSFTFPIGVIPICMFFDSYNGQDDLFFDYTESKLFSSGNDRFDENTELVSIGANIVVIIGGNLTEDKIDNLLYVGGSDYENSGAYGFAIKWQKVLLPNLVSKSQVWAIDDFIGNEDGLAPIQGAKKGDIIVDNGQSYVGIIRSINEENGQLDLIGFDVDNQHISKVRYMNSQWSYEIGYTLFRHEIDFSYTSTSGTGHVGVKPLSIITTNRTPFALNSSWTFDIANGKMISGSDDDNALISAISFNKSSNEIVVRDSEGSNFTFETISNFVDNVSPLN